MATRATADDANRCGKRRALLACVCVCAWEMGQFSELL